MRLVFTAAALFLALYATAVFAADPVRVEILSVQEQAGRLSATVAVYGPDGLPVSSLPSASVKATLDDAPLPVSGVQSSTSARAPLSVVLVVDVSGSMAGDPMTQAKRALSDFVGSLDPNDMVAIIAFDSTVRLVQDFTSDKTAATQAVSRLAPLGDTALYDAVIEATNKVSQATTERKLVVLLGDGVATLNLTKRQPSIDAARQSGVTFISIGLGSALDRPYFNELSGATGGRFLEAPTPAALRQLYANLAAAIKTQYTVVMTVPEGVDRTVAAKLAIRVSIGPESSTAEKTLLPLEGAVPPSFDLKLTGMAAGFKVKEPVTLDPVIPAGVADVTVEVFVDGQSVYKNATPPYNYQIDPATLSLGNHLLKVVATDPRGRKGERQVPFKVLAPASSSGGMSMTPLIVVLAIAAILGLVYLFLKRRPPSNDGYADRVKPWRGRLAGVTTPLSSPAGEWQPREMPAAPPPTNRALGRVIVMDESAIKAGSLDSIREYPIGSSPLTLGSTSDCDIIIHDPEGRIAGEEARLWVQRGRLVYHKLTTLSAMATEGVTSGWQFLDNGEDVRVGPCRVHFQLEVREVEPEAAAPPQRLRELWPLRPDEAEPLRASSE